MKNLVLVKILLLMISSTSGEVSLQIYEIDGKTPFDCNDEIMVGMQLSLVLSSDCNDYWSGGLFIEGQDRNFGNLSARDYDPNTRDYFGSHYDNAGEFAKVTDWKDSLIWGFDFYTFYPVDGNSIDNSTVSGDWFVIDYSADKIGECNVGFYDYDVSWSEPIYVITFFHVPTRDFDSDGKVNFTDFATLAAEWGNTNCTEPNWCNGTDFNFDGSVDCNDLALFVEYWPRGIPRDEPEDTNTVPEDPNIIYSIVDANGSSEIFIDINESMTLYIDMETNDVNIIYFDIEVDISDTNLGLIDNTEYDFSDPPGLGTARILAQPRNEFFDYWGPGIQQQEGIRLMGLSVYYPINNGYLASFVFTCKGAGDVQLELINRESWGDEGPVFPTRKGIIIHQIDPDAQAMGGGTEILTTQGSQQSVLTKEDIDALVLFLEQLWQEEEVRQNISREELDAFIDEIKKLYNELTPITY